LQSRTIIAGSIAIAICLISGSLVYAAPQGGEEVTRIVHHQSAEAESPSEDPSGGPQGIMKSCGEEVAVGPETSCELGMAVWRDEENSGRTSITIDDPGSGNEVALECEAGGASASIVCTGDGATVYLAEP
jgi:hypothetical protein